MFWEEATDRNSVAFLSGHFADAKLSFVECNYLTG